MLAAMVLVAGTNLSFAHGGGIVSASDEVFGLSDGSTSAGDESPFSHHQRQPNGGGCFGIACSGLASLPTLAVVAFATRAGCDLSWLDHAYADRALSPPRRPPKLSG